MPVENSRLKGFYKMSVDERRASVAEAAGLTDEQVEALAAHGELDEASADRMIEKAGTTWSPQTKEVWTTWPLTAPQCGPAASHNPRVWAKRW